MVETLFTFCPPDPPLRENLHSMSLTVTGRSFLWGGLSPLTLPPPPPPLLSLALSCCDRGKKLKKMGRLTVPKANPATTSRHPPRTKTEAQYETEAQYKNLNLMPLSPRNQFIFILYSTHCRLEQNLFILESWPPPVFPILLAQSEVQFVGLQAAPSRKRGVDR